MPDNAKLRGWKFDGPNGYMEIWDSGTAVATLDASNGMVVLIDGFDLSGQTITTSSATGSADLTTWTAAINGANGGNDEAVKFCAVIKVGGTAYYIPAFTSV